MRPAAGTVSGKGFEPLAHDPFVLDGLVEMV
jgi:hypothetical protein